MKIPRKKLAEILNVYYVSPHSSVEDKQWKEPRCGDCFCEIQARHTHNEQGERRLKEIIELLK